MSLATLAADIVTAAGTVVPDLHPYPVEDTAMVLPAIVVGWPQRIDLDVDYGSGREVTLPVALYLPVAGGEANALGVLQALIDGPLIDAINEALNGGAVTDVGTVSPVVVASAHALRVPLNLTAPI